MVRRPLLTLARVGLFISLVALLFAPVSTFAIGTGEAVAMGGVLLLVVLGALAVTALAVGVNWLFSRKKRKEKRYERMHRHRREKMLDLDAEELNKTPTSMDHRP